MQILIACEESGVVREAFTMLGHKAFSCDLLPSRIPGLHLQCDIRWFLEGWQGKRWDMLIAFPPCTHLCVSGARWFKKKKREQACAIRFFMQLARMRASARMSRVRYGSAIATRITTIIMITTSSTVVKPLRTIARPRLMSDAFPQ